MRPDEPWPAERWLRLPVCWVSPQLLVMPLHDIHWPALDDRPGHDPIWVDARSGEFRVMDGRHRALQALRWKVDLPARILTWAHMP